MWRAIFSLTQRTIYQEKPLGKIILKEKVRKYQPAFRIIWKVKLPVYFHFPGV